MELTFDRAIELLEITDISQVTESDMTGLARKAKKRWHPDRVSHLKDPTITAEYTEKFQLVDAACEMLRAFLAGTYQAGDPFVQSRSNIHEEPVDVIRRNAANLQSTLQGLWSSIKQRRYKWTEREVVLSDGFSLRDLLREDFAEDIAILSIVSFFYGVVFLGILSVIAGAISPVLGTVIGIVWLLQALSCILGVAPLSRFWLPEQIQDAMVKFINVGLGIYNWAEEQVQTSSSPWGLLLVRLPVLFAKLVKYVLLLPLYELAKVFVGDKVVGEVKQKVQYYADAAEWYVDELIHKNPNEMSDEELLHLSYLYTELGQATSQADHASFQGRAQ